MTMGSVQAAPSPRVPVRGVVQVWEDEDLEARRTHHEEARDGILCFDAELGLAELRVTAGSDGTVSLVVRGPLGVGMPGEGTALEYWFHVPEAALTGTPAAEAPELEPEPEPAPIPIRVTCGVCGAHLPDGARFCLTCGYRVGARRRLRRAALTVTAASFLLGVAVCAAATRLPDAAASVAGALGALVP
jgi:hypothetical protein